MVVVPPVPVIPPGLIVQVPVAGSPLNTTDPVGTVHVGCVTAPGIGAVGVVGCGLINTSSDGCEVHPVVASVTEKL